MELFFSEEPGCSKRHSGINLSGPVVHRARLEKNPLFHNTGLYNLLGRGFYPPEDQGLFKVTAKRRDMGAFRAPTLRNVALTAPYMHDGSIKTLEEVIDHYASGGRAIAEGPFRGVGRENRYKDRRVGGFPLRAGDREALVAFLVNLTDWDFIRNPAFGPPEVQASELKSRASSNFRMTPLDSNAQKLPFISNLRSHRP